ncbi:hypothetical protein ACLMJK_008240 [Lecanora helva]
MSPLPPSKRRRISTASTILTQPFKSPFKTPLKPRPDDNSNIPPPKSPHPDAGKPHLPPSKTPHPDANTPHLLTKPLPTSPPKPSLPQHAPTPRSSFSTPPPSTSLITLQRHHTNLLTTLSTLRATLSTSQQALSLESSPPNPPLESLIKVWRTASQEAAEVVLGMMRGRVEGRGGVEALGGKGNDWGRGWDDEKGEAGRVKEGDGDGEEEDGTGWRGGEYDDNDTGEKGDKGDEEEEEGGYTMGMMLKSLGIDFGTIGFERGTGRWVD